MLYESDKYLYHYRRWWWCMCVCVGGSHSAFICVVSIYWNVLIWWRHQYDQIWISPGPQVGDFFSVITDMVYISKKHISLLYQFVPGPMLEWLDYWNNWSSPVILASKMAEPGTNWYKSKICFFVFLTYSMLTEKKSPTPGQGEL